MADPLGHFTTLGKKSASNMQVRCNYCAKEFHSSKHRLAYHLAGIGGSGISLCTHVPEDVKSVMVLLINSRSRKKRTRPDDSDGTISSASSTSLPTIFKSQSRENANRLWAEFAYTEAIPFSKFSSPWFLAALRESLVVGPTYKLPSPKQLSGTLLAESTQNVTKMLESTVFRDVHVTG